MTDRATPVRSGIEVVVLDTGFHCPEEEGD